MIGLQATGRFVRQQLQAINCVRNLKPSCPTKAVKLLQKKKTKGLKIKKLFKSEHTELSHHEPLFLEEPNWSLIGFVENTGTLTATGENAGQIHLISENYDLKERIITLEQELKDSKEERSILSIENKRLESKNRQYVEEKKWLFKRNSELQHIRHKRDTQHLTQCQYDVECMQRDYDTRHLQRQGKLCSRNCVLCCICWICKHKLNVSLCGPQLDRIIFQLLHAEKIDDRFLKCEQLMQLLIESKIVDEVDGGKYLYPDEMDAKCKTMKDLWNVHIARGEGVLLLGTKFTQNAIGHCELCDLETRTKDGKILMCDPQVSESRKFRSQEEFIKYYVDADPEIECLKIFLVDLDKLREIISRYSNILHFSDDQVGAM